MTPHTPTSNRDPQPSSGAALGGPAISLIARVRAFPTGGLLAVLLPIAALAGASLDRRYVHQDAYDLAHRELRYQLERDSAMLVAAIIEMRAAAVRDSLAGARRETKIDRLTSQVLQLRCAVGKVPDACREGYQP